MNTKIRFILYCLLFIIFGITVIRYSQFIQFTKLKSINVIGCHFLPEDDIREKLKFPADQNLLFIDIDQIQKELELKDFLKTCRISRIFPSTLLVEIIENEPIAVLQKIDESYILDQNGSQLPADKRAISYFNLPFIQLGKFSIYSKEKKNVNLETLSEILTGLKTNYPEIFSDIQLFNFNGAGDVIIQFGGKTRIFADEQLLDEHFRYLDEFRKTQSLHHVLSNYSTIDLRVDNQIIVKKRT